MTKHIYFIPSVIWVRDNVYLLGHDIHECLSLVDGGFVIISSPYVRINDYFCCLLAIRLRRREHFLTVVYIGIVYSHL